jgi:beta-lactamase regulating signal transducer with metallopeptidase domain
MSVLLEWLIEGIAVAGVATAVVRLIPARYAAQRHLFLWLALLCVTALPVASRLSSPEGAMPGGGSLQSTPIHAVVLPAVPDWAVLMMLLVWGGSVLAGIVRLVQSLTVVRGLVSSAAPLSPRLATAMGVLTRVRGSSRAADILVSGAIDGACAIGYRRPHVLLSRSLVKRLEVAELEAIALHEYAHLQRFDDVTRLAQRLIVILFGLHPAVRWISRQIDIESEAACDRRAVEHLSGSTRYAHALARAAALSAWRHHEIPALAPAVLSHRAGLHARLARVLEHTWVSRRVANGVACAAATTVVGIVGIAAAWPPLVVTGAIEQSVAQLVSEPLEPAGGFVEFAGVPLLSPDEQGDVARQRSRSSAPRAAGEGIDITDAETKPPEVTGATAIVDDRGTVVDNTGDAAPLAAVALPQVVVQAERAPSVPAATPDADGTAGWSVVGEGAAQAGVNAGDAMSRAGGAIGRVFKRGGLAIARSF